MIYLPIAEIPVSILLLLSLGGVGGVLAGMFGIGGGFLITPMLIFIGVPPAVAVASSANQIIASSVSGFMVHWYRKNVDIKMGVYLLIGGLCGAVIGVWLFSVLEAMGQIDLAISLFYVTFLGVVGSLMAIESTRTILHERRVEKGLVHEEAASMRRGRLASWLRSRNMPFKLYFPRSNLHLSALMPVTVGVFAGMLVSLMGIGGGFVMIPAMIYILGMPTNVVVGTSLFQIIFTTALVTILHAVNTQTVDVVLAFLLIIGGVIGAQFGTKIGAKMKAEKLRILLAILVLIVCVRLALGLFIQPDELYTITEM